ncbi:MAG: SDR family oxidoreductase [Moorea sp. SIO2B7]|nr:SDR family oxidoreductase [Moorena sp. SIO2B7]
MKIAIIGCGYVGKAIAQFWSQSGHLVTATTTTPERITELEQVAKRVVVLKADNPNVLQDIIKDQDVVLLSIGVRASNRTPSAYRETYLETAKNLVTALKEAPNVKQIIYTGSYAVLGDKNGELVDEEAPVAPVNENGEILSETEQVLLSAAGMQYSPNQLDITSKITNEKDSPKQSIKVCILRLGGIYGKGREIVKIFGRWAGTTRPGNGEDFLNWIHLDDIVTALELVRSKQLHGIYNLANDVSIKKGEMLDTMCERHNLEKISWDSSASEVRPYNARLSNQKIKSAGLQLIYPETLI